jgi:hypothetical protein
MRHIPLPIRMDESAESLSNRLEAFANSSGLRIAMRGTLKRFPGCIHWHLRRVEAISGTIEVTFVPRTHEAWISVQSGRDAEWIDAVISGITRAVT